MKERVIIRVLIPECSLEDAIKLKKAIDAEAGRLPNATVELSTMPIRPR